jgi:hypothetical protein
MYPCAKNHRVNTKKTGVIDLDLKRFSIEEIAQGQAGETLQLEVQRTDRQYSEGVRRTFPTELTGSLPIIRN